MNKVAMILDNPLSLDMRVEKEARTLAKAGHDVTVFCKKQEGLPQEENRFGFKIKRVFPFNLGTTVLIDKYLMAHLKLIESINEKFDVYHCHDTETWPIGYILAQRDNAKFICDSHEYFPDYIVKENYTSEIKYKTTRLLVKNRGDYIKYADAVITVSEYIAEKLYSEYNLKKMPVTIYNTRPFKSKIIERKNLLREKFNIEEDKKILFFQGNIDYSRGIESILESLKYVKSKVIFIIAGNCNKEYMEKLYYTAEKYGVSDNFMHAGFLENDKLLKYTASADILLYYPRDLVKNMIYTLPNKFFDYIFSSRPIIVRDFEIYTQFIEKYNFGFACSDIYDMAEKIDTLITDRELYDKKVENSMNSHKYLSWEIQQEKLLNLYSKL